MKRLATPIVLAIFFLLYLGISFYSDEALVLLLGLIRNNPLLKALLGLLPVAAAAGLVGELAGFMSMRAVLAGDPSRLPAGYFEEELELKGAADFARLARHLAAAGYRTTENGATFHAWRGKSLFPARLLARSGKLLLFLGIFLSLTTRVSLREAVIEGEALPHGSGEKTKRISLRDGNGLLLSQTLQISVTKEEGGGRTSREFGIYPPGMLNGYFLYPRYLGVAPLVQFSAPDFVPGISSHFVLMLYPPGKEDSADIPGTRYRLYLSLHQPSAAEDPYQSGRFILRYRMVKGNQLAFAGSMPVGATFAHDGYYLAFPEVRRIVATDYVRDWGVLFIWSAALFFMLALVVWLPTRLLAPGREMLFVQVNGTVRAFSRAEGKTRLHAGAFHETLDLMARGEN
jgi:hypothetical protein